MKKRLYALCAVVTTYFLILVVHAETLSQPIPREFAPFTSDQINLIIMMLCISGIALILLLLFSIIQKNKKK